MRDRITKSHISGRLSIPLEDTEFDGMMSALEMNIRFNEGYDGYQRMLIEAKDSILRDADLDWEEQTATLHLTSRELRLVIESLCFSSYSLGKDPRSGFERLANPNREPDWIDKLYGYANEDEEENSDGGMPEESQLEATGQQE